MIKLERKAQTCLRRGTRCWRHRPRRRAGDPAASGRGARLERAGAALTWSIRCGRSRCRTTGCWAGRSAPGSTSRTTSGSFIAAPAGCTTTSAAAELSPPIAECCRTRAAHPRVRYRRQPGAVLGRSRAGLRVAAVQSRRPRRLQGQCLDRRQRPEGRAGPQVHQGRQVPAAGGRLRQECRQQRHGELSGASPRSGSIRRPTRPTSPTATATRRVAVIDADTGKMKRFWGAYGNKPDDGDLGPYDPSAPAPRSSSAIPVHCVEGGAGRRARLRVRFAPTTGLQVFQPDGKVREMRRSTPRTRAAPARSGTSRSPKDSRAEVHPAGGRAETRRVRIIIRDTLEEIASFGDGGRQPGQFYGRAQHRVGFQGQPLHDGGPTKVSACKKFIYRGIGSMARGYQGVLWPRRDVRAATRFSRVCAPGKPGAFFATLIAAR